MDERKRICKKTKDDKKTENLSVRVTPDIKEYIKQNSTTGGMTQSEFIVKCINDVSVNVVPDAHQIAILLHQIHTAIYDLSKSNDLDTAELSNSVSRLVVTLDENTHNIKKGRQ